MPQLSVIVPAYNNSEYLPECVRSITSQRYENLEIIIVDDASTDNTLAVAEYLAANDSRIRVIHHTVNSGTLASRKTGVLASHGKYVMLIDQDDEFANDALTSLVQFAQQHDADIYHFGVEVHAANDAAQQAASGMTNFLTPPPRTLHGEEILRHQFSPIEGFDWHVHHKMYSGDFARAAYALATNARLVLSDDLYMSFILDSTASTYIAIPDAPWYVYHLGRGDTLGRKLTPQASETIAQRDAQALLLLQDFVSKNRKIIPRSDWDERLGDVRNRLIEHTMNEWKDNLPDSEKTQVLPLFLEWWQADAVCGELYRYVRDYAYAYLVGSDRESQQALHDKRNAAAYLRMACSIEYDHNLPRASQNSHYLELREIAHTHLRDSGLISDQSTNPHVGKHTFQTFLNHFFPHLDKPLQ